MMVTFMMEYSVEKVYSLKYHYNTSILINHELR